MNDNIDNMTQCQDFIDLGAASAETKGPLSKGEDHGGITMPGISEE